MKTPTTTESAMPAHRKATQTTRIAIAALASFIAVPAITANATTTSTTTIHRAHNHATDQQTLQDKLDALATALEERRIAEHIPGMAVAIVHNGDVVMARGFGHANLQTNEPVTADTLFCIGSTTKCFTSALVALLADRGQLAFEDLATDRVPNLRFHDPETQANATIADLLAHRTGLTRMSLLWYGGTTTPQQIIERVQNAENYAPFREAFLYNNVMYLAAGIACEHAAAPANNNPPVPWSDLIQTEFLTPLGMNATLPLTPPPGTPGMAIGYNWNKDQQQHIQQKLRQLSNIAPAGSIVSSANDMTRWIAFQLGNGTVDGKTIVTSENLGKTRTPFPDSSEKTGYALGLFADEWNGTPYFQHGGNIDGFASAFSFMPDHKIGISLLMNISASPLQNTIHDLVFTHLLSGSPSHDPDAAPISQAQLERLAGEYIFTNPAASADGEPTQTWTVTVNNNKLFIDIPGQTNYELNFPNDEGFWPFAVAPSQIRIKFTQENDEPATQLTLFQAGMELVLPRKGTTINHADEPGAIDVSALSKYLGIYKLEPLGEVTVNITDGALAVDVPNQTNFLLAWPDENNRWNLRAVPNAAIEFDEPTDGKTYAEAFVLHQGGMRLRATRTDDGPSADHKPLPTIDDLITRRLAHNARPIGPNEPARIVYNVKLAHQGIDGTATHELEGINARRTNTDFGVFGNSTTIILNNAGRESGSFALTKDLSAKEAELQRLDNPALFATPDLRTVLNDLRVTAIRTIDGREAAIVAFTYNNTDDVTIVLDTETGDILEFRTYIESDMVGRIRTTYKMTDWKTTSDDIRLPQTITSDNVFTGLARLTLQSVTIGQNSGAAGLTQTLEQELANPIEPTASTSATPENIPPSRH